MFGEGTRIAMQKKVLDFIVENSMINSGDTILVGVSGGADSVCLLDVLVQISKKMDFKLKVLHINHMIRGREADEDEAYVRDLCESYKVEFKCVHTDVKKMAKELGMSLEEAGRKARYDAFYNVCGIDKIAVAHHMDDQVETVIHNVIRGSSLKGAGGIRPVRNNIIRPLLCVTRKDIEKYLAEKKIRFCIDSTNLENDYARNKIRNIAIPYLKENINKETVENINGFATDMQSFYDYLEMQAKECYYKCRLDDNTLNTDILKSVHEALRRQVIMLAVKAATGTLKDITRKHVQAIDDLILGNVSRSINLPYNIVVQKGYDRLIIDSGDFQGEVKDSDYQFANAVPEDFMFSTEDFTGNWEKITNDYTKIFDYDKIKSNVIIRNRLPGDYITIDSAGRRKSLKTYFIDEKIPRKLRDTIWLAACDNHILWVVGYRTSAGCNTDKTTKKILKITVRRS